MHGLGVEHGGPCRSSDCVVAEYNKPNVEKRARAYAPDYRRHTAVSRHIEERLGPVILIEHDYRFGRC